MLQTGIKGWVISVGLQFTSNYEAKYISTNVLAIIYLFLPQNINGQQTHNLNTGAWF